LLPIVEGPTQQAKPGVVEGARCGILTTLRDIVDRYGLPSVLSLRLAMENTGCVISGSYALLAIFPGTFEPNDVDFYVPSSNRDIFIGYLQQNGYALPAYPTDYQDTSPSVVGVHRLIRGNSPRTIDVVSVRGPDPLRAVVEFHSTLLMNAILSSGVVCLYASLTLRNVGLINYGLARMPGVHGVGIFDKYRLRGFSLEERLEDLDDSLPEDSHRCRVDPSCPSTVRTIHDVGVLFIVLDYVNDHFSTHRPTLVWRLANNSCCPAETNGFSMGANCTIGAFYLIIGIPGCALTDTLHCIQLRLRVWILLRRPSIFV